MSKDASSSSASSEINRQSHAERLGGRRFPVEMTQLIAGYAASMQEHSILSRTNRDIHTTLGGADAYPELLLTNKRIEALAKESPEKQISAFSQRRNINFRYDLSDENWKLAFSWLAKRQNLFMLQKLYLKKNFGIQAPTDPSYNNIFRNCWNLTSLTIRDNSLTGEGLDAAPLEKLKELQIENCDNLTDSGLRKILSKSSLRELMIAFCDKITGEGLDAAPLANLEELSITGDLTDSGLQKMLSQSPSLKKLTIHNCSITGEGLDATPLEKLKELEIEYCDNLTDSGLQKKLSQSPSLKKLTIHNCSITGEGLDATPLEKLKELVIKYCDNLTDSGLQKMLNKSPSLKKLTIESCRNITGEGLDAVHIENLEELVIRGCENLTVSGLQKMLSKSPSLRKLMIERCYEITGEELDVPPLAMLEELVIEGNHLHAVQKMLSKSSSFKKLTIIKNTNIPPHSILEVARNIPTLQELQLPTHKDTYRHTIAEFIREKPHLIMYDYTGERITPEQSVAASSARSSAQR